MATENAGKWELFSHLHPDKVVTLSNREDARAMMRYMQSIGHTTTIAPEGWFAKEAEKMLTDMLGSDA